MQVILNKENFDRSVNLLSKVQAKRSKLVAEEQGQAVLDFVSQFTDVDDPKTEVLKIINVFNIQALSDNYIKSIINLNKINDIRGIDRFLRTVNSKLPQDGMFIGCAETQLERRKRLFKKFPFYVAPFYFFFDFILKRVFPKLPVTREIYFLITAGRNRVLSKAEVLGRLAFCGFQIVDEREIGNLLYFVGTKTKSHTDCSEKHPSFGFMFKTERIGQSEKPVTVYKIRTMHPYAEYLQEYIFKRNQLQPGGKIKNDYRITSWGRVLRRLWIDEIPMIYNLLTGELKLVGVRPISQHYMTLYTEELKQKRFKAKPGLVPPFYADLPKSIEEIMQSELRYLDLYAKHPFKTDVKYFFKAMKNILFKNARSN